jgi:hypothetical protein
MKMTSQLTLKNDTGTEAGTLHSNRPISKRDLKKSGAWQQTVGGPWFAYDTNVAELKAMGYTLTTAPAAPAHWQDEPATSRQIMYLNSLGVQLETGLTKARASELIDAAKNGYLGSVNGFYRDGGN